MQYMYMNTNTHTHTHTHTAIEIFFFGGAQHKRLGVLYVLRYQAQRKHVHLLYLVSGIHVRFCDYQRLHHLCMSFPRRGVGRRFSVLGSRVKGVSKDYAIRFTILS